MRKLLCLVVISAFFAGAASAEHVDPLPKDIENNIHYRGQTAEPDRLINTRGEPAIKLTNRLEHPGDTCVITVQEVDGGLQDISRLNISKGTKIDRVRDFPTDYDIIQKGEENFGGWDGGAPKIYNTLANNPENVEIKGDIETNFPLKCLENLNGNAEWISISTGRSGGSSNSGNTESPSDCAQGEEYSYDFNKCIESSGSSSDTKTSSTDTSEETANYRTLDQKTIKGVTCDSSTEYTSVDYEGKSYSCTCNGACQWQTQVEGKSSENSSTDTSTVNSGGELDSGNGQTYGSSNRLDLELTRAEWAALASVDPEYLTEENATNLNGVYSTVSQAVRAGREAAKDNGWQKKSSEQVQRLAELDKERLNEGLTGVSGPGQSYRAAGDNYIVTEGTASPFEQDGCYSNVDYEPVKYGTYDGLAPTTFSGTNWNPGSYNCPSWMKGGDRIFYKGDVLTLDWSKLENLRGSEAGGSSTGTGSGTSQTGPVTNLQVSAASITGFSWKGYCINNAENIGIKTGDGINTGEAVKCIKPCWGAARDKQTPHKQDATCGQLVKNFCTPYYTYKQKTNKCEVS